MDGSDPGRRRPPAAVTLLALMIAAAVGGALPAEAVEEFHAFVLPETTFVDVDSLFTVSFFVDSTAHQFNGYEVTIGFDPVKVAFIDVAAGPLMTDACSTQFVFPVTTDSTITFTDVILCAGVTLNGLGVLGTFTFQAIDGGISPLSIASDPNLTFVDGGLYVRPENSEYPRQVIFHDAVLSAVGPETGAVPGASPAPPPGGPRLSFHPNPARHGGVFHLAVPRAGPAVLRVVDAAGRRLLTREWVVARAGVSRVPWDVTGLNGDALPNGVYFAQLRTPAGSATEKVVLIR